MLDRTHEYLDTKMKRSKIFIHKLIIVCNKKFFHNDDLKRHTIKEHVKDKSLEVTCLHCEKKYESKKQLLVHLKTVEKKTKNECRYCKDQFSNKEALLEHMGHKHSIQCKICQRNFLHKSSLTDHMRNIHQDKDKLNKYKCDECEASYFNVSHLSMHIKTKHSEEGGIQCELCHQKFAWPESLKRHIAAVHEGAKIKCDLCEETFGFASEVYNHKQKVHFKTHKVKCEICGKECWKSNLKKHKKLVHGG